MVLIEKELEEAKPKIDCFRPLAGIMVLISRLETAL